MQQEIYLNKFLLFSIFLAIYMLIIKYCTYKSQKRETIYECKP